VGCTGALHAGCMLAPMYPLATKCSCVSPSKVLEAPDCRRHMPHLRPLVQHSQQLRPLLPRHSVLCYHCCDICYCTAYNMQWLICQALQKDCLCSCFCLQCIAKQSTQGQLLHTFSMLAQAAPRTSAGRCCQCLVIRFLKRTAARWRSSASGAPWIVCNSAGTTAG
jgi:hypothetical protein